MIVKNSFLARGMRREGKKWKCLGLELMDLVEEGEGEGEEGEEGMMIGEVEEDDTRERVRNGSFEVKRILRSEKENRLYYLSLADERR